MAEEEGTDRNVLPYSNKRIVCVEFPGKVENVDKMMECFGGQENISKVMADKTKRLDLHFRPNDPYSYCCTGEAVPTERLLLKVRRRRRKNRSNDHDAEVEGKVEEEYQAEIVGVIETSYKFNSFVDFQYLPMVKNSSGTFESIIDKIVPMKLEDSSYFKRDVPLFVLPESFSRVDTPCDYNYKQEKQARIMKSKILQEAHLVGTDRDRRNNNAIFLKFEDKGIPLEPLPAAIEILKRYQLQEDVQKMKKLFEERPIWSRTAMMGYANLEFKNIKVILPSMAYYFVTGPWRALWCKIGYDPRKDPKSKIYQMLDVRIRLAARAFKPNIAFKADVTDVSTQLPLSLFHSRRNHPHPSKLPKLPENHYIFTRDVLPPFYQMYYQVCDIKDDELQEIVHANDGCEKNCNERDGWLLPDSFQNMRDIIHTLITAKVKEIYLTDKQNEDEAEGSEHGMNMSGDEEEKEEEEEEEEEEEGIDDEMVKEIMEYIQPRDENT